MPRALAKVLNGILSIRGAHTRTHYSIDNNNYLLIFLSRTKPCLCDDNVCSPERTVEVVPDRSTLYLLITFGFPEDDYYIIIIIIILL